MATVFEVFIKANLREPSHRAFWSPLRDVSIRHVRVGIFSYRSEHDSCRLLVWYRRLRNGDHPKPSVADAKNSPPAPWRRQHGASTIDLRQSVARPRRTDDAND